MSESNWNEIKRLISIIQYPCENDSVILFGGGLMGALAVTILKKKVKIAAICDNDKEKQGMILEGLPCILPEQIAEYSQPFVLVSTNKYYQDIDEQLNNMGIRHSNLDAYVIGMYFQKFSEVYQGLDEKSKMIYSGVLLCRMMGDMNAIEKYCCENQYFCFPKFRYLGDIKGTFIDCGAYVGDTVEDIVKNSSGVFDTIYAFEPNNRAYRALQKRVSFLTDIWALDSNQIICEKKGVGRDKERLLFRDNSSGLADSSLSAYIQNGASEDKVEIVSLDDYFKDCNMKKICFIKVDIEGLEWDMLHGAEKIILQHKPKLAICIYHTIFDFFRIYHYLKELVPEYQIHIRHHSNTDQETVLYCYL